MILRARELRYRYPGADEDVIQGLDFEIGEGEIFGFLGPNGSGKTTTQKLLTRILFGYRGEVEAFGSDHPAEQFAFVQQVTLTNKLT